MSEVPNAGPDSQSPVTISGPDAAYALEAIESQDPSLLPPPAAERIEEVSTRPHHTIQHVIEGEYAVEWKSSLVYLSSVSRKESKSRTAAQELTVKPPAQPALWEGLEEFAEGPDRADYSHLRLGKVFSAIRKQRAAKRILKDITSV